MIVVGELLWKLLTDALGATTPAGDAYLVRW
jgi:hypothetical protein